LRGLPWEDHRQEILSIHGFNQWEWEKLIRVACVLDPLMVELNLSCPNVTKTAIQEAIEAAKFAHSVLGRKVIAKLAPIRWMDFARPLMDVGVNKFHLCNTIATPGGGFSGKALKQYSLWATEEVKQTWGDKVVVIGGGGISDTIDIDDYLNAGADHVSVASLLFNPLNWKLLAIFRDFINGRKEGTALGFIPS
jgi:dihydroorotate dehydrogenase